MSITETNPTTRPVHRHRAVVLMASLFAVLGLLAAGCGGDDSDTDEDATEVDAETMMVWQRELAAVGCYDGPVDGIEGQATFEAIADFQRAEGLEVDGAIGPETRDALQTAFAEGRAVCERPTTTTTAGETTTTTAGETTTTTAGQTTTTSGETTTTTSGETTTTTSGETTTTTAGTPTL
ncbi:MAG: peptidoglycan-binding protein [Acidimicrobiia bacterium]|nr:peptidoglycan-binding protein [Acidimicrobiia bacterium]